MIFNLFRQNRADDTIAVLYGAIVAQARQPVFYTGFAVPDTTEGRLEMILLHATLAVSRLEAEPGPLRGLGQGVFDRFCSDMDANLREMGVGDMAVPRKMKAIGEAFYGRKRAYATALVAPEDAPLIAALDRNVPQVQDADPGRGQQFARYVRAAAQGLAGADATALLQGRITFPDPTPFAAPLSVRAAVR